MKKEIVKFVMSNIFVNQNESFISMDIVGERGADRIPFKWDVRLSVTRGTARALEYLHLNTESQSIVPHGNLKSSNVLFDENDKVLISNYDLASLLALPIAIQHMVSYKSPKYRNGRKVSKQSDVWSYGYLLLELFVRLNLINHLIGFIPCQICF